MQVVSVAPNSTAAVLAQNQFNKPPAAGDQFFIARVRTTFIGQGSSRLGHLGRFRALGPAGVSYTQFDTSANCGVIPDEITENEAFSGGTIEGNICWEVRSPDAGSLLMFDSPIGSDPAKRVWYRLTP